MTISLLYHSVSIRASRASVKVQAEQHGTLKVKRAPEDDSVELQVGRVLADSACSTLGFSINAAEALCHAVAAELDLVVLPRSVVQEAYDMAVNDEKVLDGEFRTTRGRPASNYEDLKEALAKCPKRSTTS